MVVQITSLMFMVCQIRLIFVDDFGLGSCLGDWLDDNMHKIIVCAKNCEVTASPMQFCVCLVPFISVHVFIRSFMHRFGVW